MKKIFPLLANVYAYIFMILCPAGTENLRNKEAKESISWVLKFELLWKWGRGLVICILWKMCPPFLFLKLIKLNMFGRNCISNISNYVTINNISEIRRVTSYHKEWLRHAAWSFLHNFSYASYESHYMQ